MNPNYDVTSPRTIKSAEDALQYFKELYVMGLLFHPEDLAADCLAAPRGDVAAIQENVNRIWLLKDFGKYECPCGIALAAADAGYELQIALLLQEEIKTLASTNALAAAADAGQELKGEVII